MLLNSISFIGRTNETIYSPENFLILSKNGYVTGKNEFLITSMAGDIVTLFPRKGNFPSSDISRLRMKFNRLSGFSGEKCLAK